MVNNLEQFLVYVDTLAILPTKIPLYNYLINLSTQYILSRLICACRIKSGENFNCPKMVHYFLRAPADGR